MITVIGTGTGQAAPAVPADATLVVGARRHVDAAAVPPGVRCVVLGPLAPALDAIEEHLASHSDGSDELAEQARSALPGGPATADDAGRARAAGSDGERGPARPARAAGAAKVVVLASGDPGFFGIVRALAERFGAQQLDVRPSSPSVAVAFARLGLTWDDAVVVSAHGRDPRTAVNVCRAHPKTAVLTGPGAGPAELGAALADTGIERTLVVAAALGTAGERVERVSPAEAAARDWSGTGVSVVLCLAEGRVLAPVSRTVAGPPPAPAGWALPEEAFAHRDSMVTKYEVRALALARLGPRTGDLVWDIGAGSGSVAVECARFGAAAVAVERSADGIERIRANAAAHGVDVQAVHGIAPDALAGLPDPDAVFIGGGGRDLPAIVAACAVRVRRVVVVTLAALDRVADVRAALAGAGLVVDGVLLQSSRLAPLPGEVSRLAATNPVFVLWATRDGGGGAGGIRPAPGARSTVPGAGRAVPPAPGCASRMVPPAPGFASLSLVSGSPPGYLLGATRAVPPAPGVRLVCWAVGVATGVPARRSRLGSALVGPGRPARRLCGHPGAPPQTAARPPPGGLFCHGTDHRPSAAIRPEGTRRGAPTGDENRRTARTWTAQGSSAEEVPRWWHRPHRQTERVPRCRRHRPRGTDPTANARRTPVQAAPPARHRPRHGPVGRRPAQRPEASEAPARDARRRGQ